MKRPTISTQQAKKEISIVEYLAAHGHRPVGRSGKNLKYKSPFRSEKDPSFFVDEAKGVWNDFGESGGSVIDLAMKIHSQIRTVQDALEHLTDYANKDFSKKSIQEELHIDTSASSLTNIQIRPLNHFVLLKYLTEKRGISEQVAKKYLRLVFYDNKNRKGLFGIGWQNDSGAWEIRSAGKQDFKTVTGSKDTTTIPAPAASGNIYLFEGMLDFLSALMIKKETSLNGKVIVLNSTAMVKKVAAFLANEEFEAVYVFFDNDGGGREALSKLKENVPEEKLRPQTFYQGFKDVNEYWVSTLK